MSEQVTDKMVDSALSAYWQVIPHRTHRQGIHVAIEAALAAREPVDAGELVKRLQERANEARAVRLLSDARHFDEAADALEAQARKIQWLIIERDGAMDAVNILKAERADLIEAHKMTEQARGTVDVWELVRRLEEDETLDGLDEAIVALKEKAQKIEEINADFLRVEKERAELIGALKPFATMTMCSNENGYWPDDRDLSDVCSVDELTCGDIRRARAVLENLGVKL
jgi:hypothetical protein